jgi:hypothetical protein
MDRSRHDGLGHPLPKLQRKHLCVYRGDVLAGWEDSHFFCAMVKPR